MAKFKCIASGNIMEFKHEVDIVTTRENPAYVEVIEEVKKEEEKPVAKKTTKKTTSEE
jgi:hypothetical protein